MKANKNHRSAVMPAVILAATVIIVVALPSPLAAQTGGATSSHGHKESGAAQWSVQVDKVDRGDVNMSTAFQVAIYENLLDALPKSKQFKQVFRSGDRNATAVPNLLVLKTRVQKYKAGNETQRAVTTVTGATKINVLSQLCSPDGKVVLELTVEGNVHFLGSNLWATHKLARNVAKKIKESTLPEPSAAPQAQRKGIRPCCWAASSPPASGSANPS